MEMFMGLLCFCWLASTIGQGAKPEIQCANFVPENTGVSCLCKKPSNVQKEVTIFWHNHSDPELKLTNVQRKDNGTAYTCLMTIGEFLKTANYILRVAFGPSDDHLDVGPSRFDTNGSQTFSLTCQATEVYPPPEYRWSGITCDNKNPQNVCVFTPDPARDHLRNVTCTAVASYTSQRPPRQAVKTIQLHVSQKPHMDCPDYVLEGEDAQCVCSAPKYVQQPSISWLGRSPSSSLRLINVGRKQDGTEYTCVVGGTGYNESAVYTLRVALPPRMSFGNTIAMVDSGISFTLEANPVPEMFRFIYLGSQLSSAPDKMSSEMFSSECTQSSEANFSATCSVKALDISQCLPGIYNVSVSNQFGSVDVTFFIYNKDHTETTYASIKVISGVSGAWLLVVAVVVVTIAVVKKRSCNNQRSKRMRQNQMNNDLNRRTSESTGRSSSNSYEEINESPGTVQEQHIPPRQEYIQDRQLPHLPEASVSAPRPDATESPLSDNQPDAHQQEEIELRALGAGTVLTDAGIPISVSTQTEQLSLLSELLLDGPGALRFDATEPSLTDNQSDAHQQEEIEMRALGARHPYENSYTPLQRTSDTDYHRYSDLK